MLSNISFTGKYMIESKELSKLSLLQKASFLSQKNALIDEFCKPGTRFQKVSNGFTVNIKDEKDDKFLKIVNQLGLKLKKIFE